MRFFAIRNIYLKVLSVIFIVIVLDMLSFITIGKVTDGRVVRYASFASGGSGYPSIKYPVIQFKAKGKDVKFNGNWDAKYDYNEEVKVVYKPWRPKKARVYTFWGLGKKPIIQIVFGFLIWSMVYSSFKPKAVKKTVYAKNNSTGNRI